MTHPTRYTFARAFAGEAAARDAWLAASRAAKARPDNVGVLRIYTPEGRHVVALVAPYRPAAARAVERLLTRAPGSLPVVLDAGVADALHARWQAGAPPDLPPGTVVRKEHRRPTRAQGVPLPSRPAGRPEPSPSPPDTAAEAPDTDRE